MKRTQKWSARRALTLALWIVGLVGVSAMTLGCGERKNSSVEVTVTVGDLISIHDDVHVDGRLVNGQARLVDGSRVSTSVDGRARLSLDGGALVAIDGESEITYGSSVLTVGKGRAFVRADDAPLTVSFGKAQAKLSRSSVAFEVAAGGVLRAYCASGEFTLTGLGSQQRVEAGETATVEGRKARVLPEKAFEDWTGGLAAPSDEEIEGKSAIAHVRARSGATDAGVPLVVRSHHVDTKIVGEVAVTRGVTTFFNGSDTSGDAYVRLAIPDGAFITKVEKREPTSEDVPRELPLMIASGPARKVGERIVGLEWAGGGWLQGTLGQIPAGQTLELSVTYAEWLDVVQGRATYRYAMDTDRSVSPVGELGLRVDAQETRTEHLSVSSGAKVERREAVFRAADVRPRGDFVVELLPDVVQAGKARAYVQRDGVGSDDAYVMVRTELPERSREGVTLAIVVDTSLSVGTSTLETSLSVVDAIVRGLSPEDSVVVIAADETARTVGPKVPTKVSPELRATLERELSELRAGGASDLLLGLVSAADLLDTGDRSDQSMIVYVGDGTPTVGAPDAASIRDVLEGRPTGMPRVGAVAVGGLPNRWLLARLTQGAGMVVEVRDRADAARAGSTLLAEALTPRYSGVEVDLGPHIDRIYPRRPQVVTAGSTMTVVGRLKGPMPQKARISYRDGAQGKTVETSLVRSKVPPSGDLHRLWARARIEQIVSEGEGVEPAIALAQEAGLLTPWTGFLLHPPQNDMGTPPVEHRILDLSLEHDVAFSQVVDPFFTGGSSLIEPGGSERAESTLVEAAEKAMHRIIDSASRSIRACRDARAVVSPQVANSMLVSVTIDGGGKTTKVVVVQQGTVRQDEALSRCVEGVVKSLPYVAVGATVSVNHAVNLSGKRTLRPTKCSDASKVSLPVRREIWRSRSPSSATDFLAAAEECELKRWSDRQEFLRLIMSRASDPLDLARDLESAGEQDAAEFVRNQALRSVKTFAELQGLMQRLRQDEPAIERELEAALEKAKSDKERVEICRNFLRLAPHDTYARRRLLALLEALGDRERAIGEIRKWRDEPVADAALLAEGAAALLRFGEKAEGRRAFGELIERAPRDPWTFAFVGDRLRAVGMFDEAQGAYDSLARLLPHDGSVVLRQALAHAGAGRVDVASRLFDRVAQTGGRSNEGRLSDLATIAEAVTLASVRGGEDAEVEAEIERRLLRTPLPDAMALIFVHSPPAEEPVSLELVREQGETMPLSGELDARELGLIAARVERGQKGAVRLALRRDKVVGPSRPLEARVSVLRLGEAGTLPELSSKTVQVAADGSKVEISVSEGRIL